MNDEKEIRNLVDTWMTASKAGDSETVLGLPMVRSGHTLAIFRKDAGKWRIARDANLLVPVSASQGGA